MGSRKLPMKLIASDKSRKATFFTRSKGIKKKAYELSKLCGIDVLMICFGSDQDKAETWPEDPSEIDSIIRRYRNLSRQDRWNNAVKAGLCRGANTENLSNPSSDYRFNDMSSSMESQQEFVGVIDTRIEMVKMRIELLDREESLTLTKGKELVISPPPPDEVCVCMYGESIELGGGETVISQIPISCKSCSVNHHLDAIQTLPFQYSYNYMELGCFNPSLPPLLGSAYGLGKGEYYSNDGFFASSELQLPQVSQAQHPTAVIEPELTLEDFLDFDVEQPEEWF